MIVAVAVTALLAPAATCGAQSAYLTRIPDSIDRGSGEVVVIDTARDAVRTTIPLGEHPINLAVTPDRSKVYVASYLSQQVYVIDTASNAIAARFGFGYGDGHYLSRPMVVTPDGRKVYEINEHFGSLEEMDKNFGNLSVVDVASNAVSATIPVGQRPVDFALAPDGAKLYVVNQMSNSVSVIDAARETVVATIAVDDGPYHAILAPDGRFLYVAHFSDARQVSVIDTANNAVVAKITVGSWFCEKCVPETMTITPDGRKLYVAVPELAHMAVVDTAKREVISTINVGTQKLEGNSMAMTADGRTLYVSPGSGTLSVVETARDRIAATLPVDGTVSLAPDERRLYLVGTADVSVIDTASNKMVADIPVGGFGKLAFTAAQPPP